MTLVVLFLTFYSPTPPWLWIVAMVCDTAMIVTYMLTRAL